MSARSKVPAVSQSRVNKSTPYRYGVPNTITTHYWVAGHLGVVGVKAGTLKSKQTVVFRGIKGRIEIQADNKLLNLKLPLF